jgi:hypothetical protein
MHCETRFLKCTVGLQTHDELQKRLLRDTEYLLELERRQVRNQDEVDGAPDAGHNSAIRNPTLLA